MSNNSIEVSHAHMLGPFNCLSHLMLMLLGQERDNLSAYSAETLHNLRLFLHLDIQSVRHLIVHDVMPVHLCLLCGQFLTLQLQTVVLSLEELKLLFNMIQRLQNGKFHACMAWHQRSLRWSSVRVHDVRASADDASPNTGNAPLLQMAQTSHAFLRKQRENKTRKTTTTDCGCRYRCRFTRRLSSACGCVV